MNLNLCYFSFYLPPPSPNPLGVRLLLLSINCRNFKLLFYKFIFTSLLWKYIMHHSWRKYWISGLHPVGEFTFDDIRKKLMSVKIFLYILKAYMMVYINTMFWDPPSPPPPLGETLPCHQSKKWSKNPNMKSKLSLLVFV